MGKALVGQKEIAQYARRSWQLVLLWIRTADFPAKKLGGTWESSTELIDEWKRKQLES